MDEYRRYRDLMSQEKARAMIMPAKITHPKFVPKHEIERVHCNPDEVKVHERVYSPDGGLYVKLQCTKRNGATRERSFSKEQMQCYFNTVALEKASREGKDPHECDKVKAALVCADDITPTLTEQLSGTDVTRKEANECLLNMLRKGELSAEYHWQKFGVFPPVPPRVTEKQLHDMRLGQYFAGEPIYATTTGSRESMEFELAEKELELAKKERG